MSDQEKDLMYTPSLDYKKNYDTTGLPSADINFEGNNSDDDYKDSISDLIDSIDRLENVIKILPDDMKNAVKIPLRGVEYVIGTIDQSKHSDTVPTDREVIISIDDVIDSLPEDDFDDVPDDPFSSNIIDPIKIEVVITPKDEYIDKLYAHDLVSILQDYVNNLEIALSPYINTLAAIAAEAGLNSSVLGKSNYAGNADNIKDTNNLHLSDSIIRMQIMREQKIRLFRKLYDVDSTILHIRSCKSTSELRKRYYKEEYRSNNELLDIGSNTMLSDARAAYDKKYKENFKNLYKYLNSSVILLNECLKMHLHEMQAKAILINKEGIDIK